MNSRPTEPDLPQSNNMLNLLVTQISIRAFYPPDQVAQLSDDEILRMAGLLSISCSLDEFEQGYLGSETITLVSQTIAQLQPFTVSGQIVLSYDNINVIARLSASEGVYVSDYTLNDSYLLLRGYCSDQAKKLQITSTAMEFLEARSGDSLTAPGTLAPSTTSTLSENPIVIAVRASSDRIDNLLENFRSALYKHLPVWGGKVKLSVDMLQVTLEALGTLGLVAEEMVIQSIQARIVEYQGYHQTLAFSTSLLQSGQHVMPYLLTRLQTVLPEKLRSAILNLTLDSYEKESDSGNMSYLGLGRTDIEQSRRVIRRQYFLNYRTSRSQEIHLEELDLAIEAVLAPLLAPNGALRCFAYYDKETTNELSQGLSEELSEQLQSFYELEDLIPDLNAMICPGDRELQLRYAQFQGYSEGTMIEKLLQRRVEYLASAKITRVLAITVALADQAAFLHYLFSKFTKLRLSLSVTVIGDLLQVSGNILSLKDAIAIILLMGLSLREALQSRYEQLQLLATIGEHLMPSELIAQLYDISSPCDQLKDPAGSSVRGVINASIGEKVVKDCSSPAQCYATAATAVAADVSSEANDYRVITIPLHLLPSLSELRQYMLQRDSSCDITLVRYQSQGRDNLQYSIYSRYHSSQSDILSAMKGSFQSEPFSTKGQELRINARDYKLDILEVDEYYRLDVVAVRGQAGVERYTLASFPTWLALQYPTMLDQLHRRWITGKLLSAQALELYRVTDRLWPTISRSAFTRGLRVERWELLSCKQASSLYQLIAGDEGIML